MTRKKGMHPQAFQSWIDASFAARISPDRLGQTVGTATKSAGTHAPDGKFKNERGHWENYTAALDVHIDDIDTEEERRLMLAMRARLWAVWLRDTGSFASCPHLHAIYIPLKKKEALDTQVEDFLEYRSGLVGHRRDWFWWQHQDDQITRLLRAAHQASRAL